jgi:phosphoribosylanthranilate isomerase
MWIKICGITQVEDATVIAAAGADAIGLNFYAKSPRHVSVARARKIADAVRPDVETVGVFVNMPVVDMIETADTVGLTAVQFHGDEPPDVIAQFQSERPAVSVIRALRIGASSSSLKSALQPLNVLKTPVAGILVDAFVPGEYGGTGRTISPAVLRNHQHLTSRLILAGGLNCNNVAEIAKTVAPWGIDTASGVEVAPGKKSEELVYRFVTNCRSVGVQKCSSQLKDS